MSEPPAKRTRTQEGKVSLENVPSEISDYLTYDVVTTGGTAELVGKLREGMSPEEYLSLCIDMLTCKGGELKRCPLMYVENLTGLRTIYDIEYTNCEELVKPSSWVVAQLFDTFGHVATFWETKPIKNQQRPAVFAFESYSPNFETLFKTLQGLRCDDDDVMAVMANFTTHLQKALIVQNSPDKSYKFAVIGNNNILTIYDPNVEQNLPIILSTLRESHPDLKGELSRFAYPDGMHEYNDDDDDVDDQKAALDIIELRQQIRYRLDGNPAFVQFTYFEEHVAAIMVTRSAEGDAACFHCGFSSDYALPAWALVFNRNNKFEYPVPIMHEGSEGRCVLTALHCTLHFLKTLLNNEDPALRYTKKWIDELENPPSSTMLPYGLLEVMLADIPTTDPKKIVVSFGQAKKPVPLIIQEARQHMHSLLQCTKSKIKFPTQITSIGGKDLQTLGLVQYAHCTISVPFLDLAVSR